MNNCKKRYKTHIFKNDREFQVSTRFILSLEERKTILIKGFSIDEFILELINNTSMKKVRV